ncbi:MAG: sigma-70 family RNA polymerase sigma factor [Alphaproteobacteria bacterium]|nr:sigma-70 family RNA polymerase sigma factor [Alphaproteobacteria bacterium]
MAGYEDQIDEDLMGRVLNGDRRAFAVLVHRHANLFFAAAWRMCGQTEEAEDIVQEAFLKLWSKPGAFDPAKGAKFTTWFYRVVTNLAIDKMRRRKKFVDAAMLDTVADKVISIDLQMVERERAQVIEQAVQALPERQKIALNLCFYEGLSNKEAAEVLGVGVKALESLLMRAKAALRTALEKSDLLGNNNDDDGRKIFHAG